MYKLGPKLHRDRRQRIVNREDAPPDAVCGFQTTDRLSRAAQRSRRGEPRDSRADNDDIAIPCLHPGFRIEFDPG
jgi:hypothetical protein